MSYDFFEIPSRDGRFVDVVLANPDSLALPSFVHYGYAVASATNDWNSLATRRGIPLEQLRDWPNFSQRNPAVVESLESGRGYVAGAGVLNRPGDAANFAVDTAMRLGALEVIANISSGRITASDKDPFPHQLALQQFMRAKQNVIRRVLVADEVGLGKTIEAGLILRDLLVAAGSLDDFSCIYLTSGGLVGDAAQKLRSVLKGVIGDQSIVSEVDSFVRFGVGSTRGVHVASMHAARRYVTDSSKTRLPTGVKPDVVIIDECHHAAAHEDLTSAPVGTDNALRAYIAAHRLIEGKFWPDSKAPRLVILMSATPFRNAAQFTNLLRLLLHGVDDFDAYAGASGAQLVDRLHHSEKAFVAWRQQTDASVRSWSGGGLFPNLTIVRPHREGDQRLNVTPEYVAGIEYIKTQIASIMKAHQTHFGGFASAQLEKKLTSSSIAGACYLFGWCVRHSAWPKEDAYKSDRSSATESIRTLIRGISRRLADFDVKTRGQYLDVYFPSEKFTFSRAALSHSRSMLDDIFEFHKRLREFSDEDSAFVAAPDEIEMIARLGSDLLKYSKAETNTGVENAKLNWLNEMLVTYPDSRFLVFTESLQTCSIIESTMPQKCVALTGDLGESERRRLVAEFRDPASSVRVLVATSAADEGFDFQVANRVVHWDLSSSPATLMQRNGRVARLGQVADVTAYYLILPGTHEERRDRTLQRHFAELGVGDIQLQLKILGTLTEDEQARLDEAIEHESEMVVEEILKRARAGNTEMDRKLQEVRKPLEEVAVLDRDQLATRLEVWNKLELPSQIEDISVTFDTVRWQKPMFGARTTVVESAARTAIITSASLKREVTFDPEFLLFSKTQRAYELAGLRPWTPRREQDGQVKIRPDPTVDLIGKMACGLARLPRADFAAIGRKALALCIPELDHAEYLLFVTHPMREAETIRPTPRASYITFFAFTEASTEPLLTADGSQVHKIVSLLEREAFVRRAPLTKNVAEVHFAAGKRYCEWLRQQVRIGRSGFRGGADYYVPIPIALVAVDAVNASRDIVAPPDVSSALDLIRGALEHGAETEAVDLTVELFDGLLLASDFDGAGRVLQVLDPRVLPPKVLTGVLMITRYAREKLGENRRAFLARVESALSENWHLNADDVAAIIRRLA